MQLYTRIYTGTHYPRVALDFSLHGTVVLVSGEKFILSICTCTVHAHILVSSCSLVTTVAYYVPSRCQALLSSLLSKMKVKLFIRTGLLSLGMC